MATPAELRSLLMRANRQLGANLVERNLVGVGDLQAANDRLWDAVTRGEEGVSLLGLLTGELGVLRADTLLRHGVEHDGIGLVDLREYDVPDEFRRVPDPAACRATWTVPFDRHDGFTCVASAYFLSPAVRTHWEERLPGPVLWFGTTLEAIADHLAHLGAPVR